MNNPCPLKNNRILVVDDNPAIHEDIRKILCGPSQESAELADTKALLFEIPAPGPSVVQFEIDSAFQGEEGLRRVQAALEAGRPYAVAFVDVRMPPGWDGVETIARIWKEYSELQVVICTAYSDHSWDQMIRQIGRSDGLVILKKPFDNIEVLQLAHALTQKWALRQQVKCLLNDLDQLVSRRTGELEAANRQLDVQAQEIEAVGQLAAGLAHDFNNILTVIQGNACLLLNSRTAVPAERKPLESICAAADRAGKLARQLLEVRSQAGQGSTFPMFPQAGATAPAAAAAPPPTDPVQGGHETLMVVEDEDAVRNVLVGVLEAQGYKVLAAASGTDALERWGGRKQQVDLLLTDMAMPGGLSGRQLAERLLPETAGLKVIYTSGYNPGLAGIDPELLEGENFLAKPYRPAKLLQMVRSCLDRRPP